MPPATPHLRLVTPGSVPDAEHAYRTYSAYVAAIALHLLGRDNEVDDVVQDVFLAGMRGLSSLREPGAIKGWLATVTVRMCMSRLKRRRLRSFLDLDSATENDIASTSPDPAERLMLARVYAVLDELSPKERVPWILHHVDGETLPVVATLCACSLATIKRRIAAAQHEIEARLG